MEYQEPAEGISKTRDFGDSVFYKVLCDCGDDDHSHTLEVEADDFNVVVHIYTKVTTPYGSKRRWRQIWNLLWKGYTEEEVSLVLTEQQAYNYAETLKRAMERVKQAKDNHRPT